MGKTHLVMPDSHAHPDYHNKRANWLGKLILDIKPDVVVNMGDMWDMPSMNTFESGKKTWGRDYKRDIDAGLDFDERLWHYVRKAKKKKPRAVFIEGNHEHRLARVLNDKPELEGLISYNDFNLNRNYDDVVLYDGGTPGIIDLDGVSYAHFHVSGVMGKPIGGIHQAYSLTQKLGTSATMGHTHTRGFAEIKHPAGTSRLGMVCGVFQDYKSAWAGGVNDVWWSGVVIKREVENGVYDHQWVSIESLKKEYK